MDSADGRMDGARQTGRWTAEVSLWTPLTAGWTELGGLGGGRRRSCPLLHARLLICQIVRPDGAACLCVIYRTEYPLTGHTVVAYQAEIFFLQ